MKSAVKNPIVPKVRPDIAEAAKELQRLQRKRSIVLKSRNMQANRLQAIVAGTLGYHSGMEEKERTKMFKQATAMIELVEKGEECGELDAIIRVTLIGIRAFEEEKAALEKEMVKLAKSLPIAKWVEHKDQRGFGHLFLAIVIGETGDLANYANPGKVWRRLGCAPWTFDGQTLMGATWKSGKEGKLPAAEWEAFGYSPRRRSIAFLVGDGIVKLNKRGPYRKRWLEAKIAAYKSHPEWNWKPCDKCDGPGSNCGTCGGTGKKCQRAHRHGMLLATKRLLKNLWCEWNS